MTRRAYTPNTRAGNHRRPFFVLARPFYNGSGGTGFVDQSKGRSIDPGSSAAAFTCEYAKRGDA